MKSTDGHAHGDVDPAVDETPSSVSQVTSEVRPGSNGNRWHRLGMSRLVVNCGVGRLSNSGNNL